MVKFDGNRLCWNQCSRREIRKTDNLFGSIKIFAYKDHVNKLKSVSEYYILYTQDKLFKNIRKFLWYQHFELYPKFKYTPYDLPMTSLISNFRFTLRNAQEITIQGEDRIKLMLSNIHGVPVNLQLWNIKLLFFQNQRITF